MEEIEQILKSSVCLPMMSFHIFIDLLTVKDLYLKYVRVGFRIILERIYHEPHNDHPEYILEKSR